MLARGAIAALVTLVSLVAVVALVTSCAPPAVVTEEPSVGIVSRSTDGDQGAVLVFDARVCTVTIHAASGALHDVRSTADERDVVDMTRAMPDRPWQLQSSAQGAVLVTVVRMPPGRYAIVGYAATDAWTDQKSPTGRALGYTDCKHRDVVPVKVDHPFDVRAGLLTIVDVARGAPGFETLTYIAFAKIDPYVTSTVGDWLGDVDRAVAKTRAALVASRKQPRDGYDVYPDCDGKTAVVHATGTPFAWASDLENAAAREELRGRVLGALAGVHSGHASGFGGGCVERAAPSIFIADPGELDAAVRDLGAWMVRENLRGEVDVVVTPVPRLL